MKSIEPGVTGGLDPLAPLCTQHPPECGFLSGTPILTGDGILPVEYLSPGDRIVSRNAGMVTLESVTSGVNTLEAVSVAPGALGRTDGPAPLELPADQPVLVRDWRAQALWGRAQVIVPVSALVDGEFIRPLGPRRMVLHALHFAQPVVLYAGGVEAAGALTAASRRRVA